MTGTLLALLAFALVAGASFRWFRAAQAVALPANRSFFVAAWAGGALLGALAVAQGVGWLGGALAGLAILAGCFLCALIAISGQRVAVDAIQVGATVPEFSAVDADGEVFESSQLAGHPTLIKFFRGHW
jgi:hypothetical protein